MQFRTEAAAFCDFVSSSMWAAYASETTVYKN